MHAFAVAPWGITYRGTCTVQLLPIGVTTTSDLSYNFVLPGNYFLRQISTVDTVRYFARNAYRNVPTQLQKSQDARDLSREINRRSRSYGIELRPTLFIVGASTRMCFNSDNGLASHRFYPMAGLPSLFVRPSIILIYVYCSFARFDRVTGAFYWNATRPNDRSSVAREGVVATIRSRDVS